MDMMNTVRELKKGYTDMMDLCKRKLCEDMFDDDSIDTECIEAMRCMFNMCNLAMQLVEQQAETIHEMNNKLDRLLEQRDEG